MNHIHYDPIMWYEMCVRIDKGRCLRTECSRGQLSSTTTHNAWFKPVCRCISLYDFRQGLTLWICRCVSISKQSTESRALNFLCNLLFCKARPLFWSLNKTKLLPGGSWSFAGDCLDTHLWLQQRRLSPIAKAEHNIDLLCGSFCLRWDFANKDKNPISGHPPRPAGVWEDRKEGVKKTP